MFDADQIARAIVFAAAYSATKARSTVLQEDEIIRTADNAVRHFTVTNPKG